MTHGSRAAIEPVSPPSLDAPGSNASRPKPQTKGSSTERRNEEPVRWLELTIRLALMLGVCSIPLVVLLLFAKTDIWRYASPDASPVFGGCWAVFALWITLDMGMGRMSREDASGLVWFLLGLINLIGAAIFFANVQALP